jgi:hypothetical protein
MIAAQLIATHNATMECYRRAMIAEQTLEGRRENLNQANKLARTYATLIEALNRHRGKGQQKVTVEHVQTAAPVDSAQVGLNLRRSSGQAWPAPRVGKVRAQAVSPQANGPRRRPQRRVGEIANLRRTPASARLVPIASQFLESVVLAGGLPAPCFPGVG